MARATWNEARRRGQTASFDYYKEPLVIVSGAETVPIDGILDTAFDDLEGNRAQQADGTFPVIAKLSVWRFELGYLPVTGQEMRIARADRPQDERIYLVVTVDDSSDLIDIELQAQQYNGSPYHR